MPSPEHQAYRESVRFWFRRHAGDPDVAAQLQRHARAAANLSELDLEPARPILAAGYAPSPRGGKPWDPIVLLRCLLLALEVGQPSLNKWVEDLAASRTLRVLAGLPGVKRPGVGTLYGFLHRLHDGSIRGGENALRPSEAERRRASAPRPVKQDEEGAAESSVTAKLVAGLEATKDVTSPNDLLERLGAILRAVAVQGSLERGLLGDLTKLAVAGDGSPLRTGANRHGKRGCGHDKRERCKCPRIFADPDARIGWDHYREQFFYGHHFYEIIVNVGGHDLPLAIRLDPGNATDHTASVLTLDRLFKVLPSMGMSIHHFIADAGHDSEANHRYCQDRGARAVIPLRGEVKAIHPDLPELALSPRGIPMCPAHVEMVPRGSADPFRPIFACPVKASKLDRCPLAPADEPDWVCRPDQKCGPVVAVDSRANPRICPQVPRNSKTYERLYALRSGCERSNSVKKRVFKLEEARHRRASFWLMRLHLIAVLQHARAWVADGAVQAFVDDLLGREPAVRHA